jgi:hypothetical protein
MRNTTDPDSRIMRHRGMAIQGYNAQVVASREQIILAADVTNSAVDHGQLTAMLDHARATLARAQIDEPISTVLADGGYFNSGAIQAALDDGLKILIPSRRSTRTRPTPRTTPQVRALNAALEDPDNQALYRRRQVIVEPVFARTRHHRQINRLLKRGLAACRAEWQLIATTHNLLKLYSAQQPA